MHHIMFVYAFDRELFDNENAGVKSYQALWMRIQSEKYWPTAREGTPDRNASIICLASTSYICTHLLHCVYYLVYQKLIQNTYLPMREQSGFLHELDGVSANTPIANEMLLYALKHLKTDKLYYLFRSYLNTEDPDEKFLLQADLEGDFVANASLKKIYRRIFNQPVNRQPV